MITTITTRCCSASTSTWRIVAACSDGADTTASRFVTCDSASVVWRIASSTSLRIGESSGPALQREALAGHEHAIDDIAMTGVGRHPAGRDMGMGEQPLLLEQRQLVSHRRRPALELRVSGDRARGNRLAGAQVVVDHLAQNPLLT